MNPLWGAGVIGGVLVILAVAYFAGMFWLIARIDDDAEREAVVMGNGGQVDPNDSDRHPQWVKGYDEAVAHYKQTIADLEAQITRLTDAAHDADRWEAATEFAKHGSVTRHRGLCTPRPGGGNPGVGDAVGHPHPATHRPHRARLSPATHPAVMTIDGCEPGDDLHRLVHDPEQFFAALGETAKAQMQDETRRRERLGLVRPRRLGWRGRLAPAT